MPSLLPTKGSEREYMVLGLRIVGDFGATIAIPVVVFVNIGQWLDRTYGIGPYATIGAFVLAALLSGYSIYKKAKRYGQWYTEIGSRQSPPSDINTHQKH